MRHFIYEGSLHVSSTILNVIGIQNLLIGTQRNSRASKMFLSAIKEKLGSSGSPGLPVAHPQSLILTLACLTEQYMGGSSGGVSTCILIG